MTDIFMTVGVLVSLFFVTFFIPFMTHIVSEGDLPSEEGDFAVIFFFAWFIVVIIATTAICSCFSMQKELDKYEQQEKVETGMLTPDEKVW